MKKILTLLTVAFAALAVTMVPGKASAQTFKFGHINSQLLVALMPERDSAVVKIQKYSSDLEETYTGMQNDFNAKAKAYQDNKATWSQTILDAKTQELNDLQQRMQQFGETAQKDLSARQETLMGPVAEKAQAAIDKVAKSHGFTYIFDTSIGALIYINETQSEDILPLCKAELKIPASKTKPTQFGQQAAESKPAAK
ncbi:MAG: OmpH family outer membrane protein [Bacteroidales bacterium]|jgi:outer membrane protein|nr:OmpH family outer membrane protein [Bacteroidales bacterium]MCI1733919.1 OmpH family outer membrane protein [Bacteroidales bacterium]